MWGWPVSPHRQAVKARARYIGAVTSASRRRPPTGLVLLLLAVGTAPGSAGAGEARWAPVDARWDVAGALSILYPPGRAPEVESATAGCPPDADAIACVLSDRYRRDPKASKLAAALFERAGWMAGVERPYVMDGGWRGKIRIVPELPVGAHRRHLKWVAAAAGDFEVFFAAIAARAPAPPRYRWRDLAFYFFRSVGRTTPSAYAGGWELAYNVSGSLHRSADKVRRTLFHEIFHLNDAAHDDWSSRALLPIYDSIIARCGGADDLDDACLKPFAPHGTRVKGGTYYAFHPGEGVEEYGAELAIRYYREQRAMIRDEPLAAPPFKCGADENARAWRALADEFFGGVDLVPPCS